MSHLNTHVYAFLKDSRVISSVVFENHDDQDLLESVKQNLTPPLLIILFI